MAKVLTTPATARPSSPVNWILLAVGVAVFTVFAVSVPRLVQPAGWASGDKFLYLALIGYLGASVLYGLAVALHEDALQAGGVALMRGAFLLHTTAVIARWVTAGHAPLSSIYEMVLMFSWAVAAFQLVAEWKLKIKFLGAITLPVAALALVLLQVLPGEIHPLVPALQSTWLQIHVTLAMLSYAGFTLSFGLALLYLIKDGVTLRSILAWTSGLVAAIYVSIIITSVDKGFRLLMPAWDGQSGGKIMIAPKQALMVGIDQLGWPFVLTALVAVAALIASFQPPDADNPEAVSPWARRLFMAAMLGQTVAFLLLLAKVNMGPYSVPGYPQDFEVRFSSSPFLLAGMLSAIFASLAWLALQLRFDAISTFLPQRAKLDELIYQTVAVSFPLLTLMIMAGAFWANRTWGSYWSWDPKEDWALITWLTYAGYLHMRLTRGWRGRRSAYFAIVGFAVVMFTFFGVTYLLPGLHSYS
jgi:cytochrome c-type biogenesis protein CcsB